MIFKTRILVVLIKSILFHYVLTDNINLLKKGLHTSVFDTWSYNQNFTNFQTLKLNQYSVNAALRQDGSTTNQYLIRLFDKAVRGENVTMLTLGGSSSKGADLGCSNRKCTYHYAISDWWNKIIYPSTGSFMKREVIAIGGCGTAYFAHCWKEYLSKNEIIDLILWEFFLNDPDYLPYGVGVEKFIRSIYSYPTQPILIFTKFFSRGHFPTKYGIVNLNEKSGTLKTKVIDTLSRYYGLTVIDLLIAVQTYIKTTPVNNLTADDMFINHHPSHLAHAQLTYLIIEYFRKQFFTYLNSVSFSKRSQSIGFSENNEIELPTTLFDVLDEQSVCWSAVMPDDRFIMPHNLYTLPVLWNYGFAIYRTPLWKTEIAWRRDVRGGYIASSSGKYLKLSFQISNSDFMKNVYIAISHEPLGGYSIVSVTDSTNKTLNTNIDCSRNSTFAMSINFIGQFAPGSAQLSVATTTGGCHFSAIIVE